MNPAGVLLVASLTFWAGRISHHRTIRGLRDELEWARVRVDDVDHIADLKDRWRDQARRYFDKVLAR